MSSQTPAQMRVRYQNHLPDAPPSIPTRPTGSPVLMGSHTEGLPTADNHVPFWTGEESTERREVISIDTLPNDVLLVIFDICGHDEDRYAEWAGAWRSLVHVCRRWRRIVFGSSRDLNLRLVCAGRTRARDMLDIWPALPLAITSHTSFPKGNEDNIIAALERSDRVCQIYITNARSSSMEIFLAAMQRPFPELTDLILLSSDETVPVDPDSFLGGNASPRLEELVLDRISFPGLPKVLSSASHLLYLMLQNIPHSGYISPKAMATALSTLTSLESLTLEFLSPQSCPDRESQHLPSTRSVLPVLTAFRFKGVSEYLDVFVACIDTPQLNTLDIVFFNDIVFVAPQFIQFIDGRPSFLKAFEKAHISLRDGVVSVNFSSLTSDYRPLNVEISCRGLDWQISSVAQLCTSCLPPFSVLEVLYIHERPRWKPSWKDDIENRLWVELLLPFNAVKNLYLSKEIAPRIAPALQELVEGRTAEVLPTLKNIFLEGFESSKHVQEGIGQFVAARQVASHPISVSHWANSESEKFYY